MSDKLPKSNNTDEVDLGKVFSYIEKLFIKIGQIFAGLFAFLGSILKNLGVFFLLGLKIFKKHFIIIVGSTALVYLLLYFLDKRSVPIYQSNIIVNQNYNSGKLLYNNILRYNILVKDGDSMGIAKELGIAPEVAAKFVGFEIYDNKNKNELQKEYQEYIKETDSLNPAISPSIVYEDFKFHYDLENVTTQTIFVASSSPDVYNGLANKIIQTFEENEYFLEEKRKATLSIQNKIKSYKSMLSRSDSLQNNYIELLKSYYGDNTNQDEPNATTVNLNLTNNKDKINTKEFELFVQQNAIKLQMVDLENELLQKQSILRLESDFTPAVKLDGFYKTYQIIFCLIFAALIFLFFFFKEFKVFDFIDKYGDKENLFKK
jgi:hypothetical protein